MGTKISLFFKLSWVSCASSDEAEQATLVATTANHIRERRERARIRPSGVESTLAGWSRDQRPAMPGTLNGRGAARWRNRADSHSTTLSPTTVGVRYTWRSASYGALRSRRGLR